MFVAMYYSNNDIRLEEAPVPAIGRKELLMRVEASGICGSDVMEWYRADKVPLVLGHEVSGVVVEKGPGVRKFKRGDRIVTTHHVPCQKCEYCLKGHPSVCETLRKTKFYPGGFSQFLRLPSLNIEKGTLKISRTVSFDDATFVEPLGCVVRGQRLAGGVKGKRVLVVGSGISGLLHVKLARYDKAKSIIASDIDPYRLRKAKEFGATAVISAKKDVPAYVRNINKGKLAELVILCTGAQSAVEQALRSVDRGGTVLVFSAAKKGALLPVSINDIFWRNEITILSSYAAPPEDLSEALDLISKRKIKVSDMITHRLRLKDTQKGFDLVVKPRRSIKVVIHPNK